jgi:hypothetical protein
MRYYSRNRFLHIDGETRCLRDWARESGVDETLIWHRLNAGVDPEIAVFKPPRRYSRRGNKTQNINDQGAIENPPDHGRPVA